MSADGEPPLDRSLVKCWADVHAEAWRVSYRQPGSWGRLNDAVEGLLCQLADRMQLDELGRTPAEVEAEAAQLAALESIGDEDDELQEPASGSE